MLCCVLLPTPSDTIGMGGVKQKPQRMCAPQVQDVFLSCEVCALSPLFGLFRTSGVVSRTPVTHLAPHLSFFLFSCRSNSGFCGPSIWFHGPPRHAAKQKRGSGACSVLGLQLQLLELLPSALLSVHIYASCFTIFR